MRQSQGRAAPFKYLAYTTWFIFVLVICKTVYTRINQKKSVVTILKISSPIDTTIDISGVPYINSQFLLDEQNFYFQFGSSIKLQSGQVINVKFSKKQKVDLILFYITISELHYQINKSIFEDEEIRYVGIQTSESVIVRDILSDDKNIFLKPSLHNKFLLQVYVLTELRELNDHLVIKFYSKSKFVNVTPIGVNRQIFDKQRSSQDFVSPTLRTVPNSISPNRDKDVEADSQRLRSRHDQMNNLLEQIEQLNVILSRSTQQIQSLQLKLGETELFYQTKLQEAEQTHRIQQEQLYISLQEKQKETHSQNLILKQQQEEIDDLYRQIQVSNRETNKIKEMLKQNQANLYEQELKILRQENATLRTDVMSLRQENSELQENNFKLQEDTRRLQLKFNDMNSQRHILQQEFEQKQQELQQSLQKQATHFLKINELQQIVQNYQTENEKKSNEINVITQKITNLNKKCMEQEQQIVEFEEIIKTQTQQIKSHRRASSQALKEQVNQQHDDEQLNKLQSQFNLLKEQQKNQDDRYDLLKQTKEQEILELHKRIQQMQVGSDDMMIQNNALSTQNEKLKVMLRNRLDEIDLWKRKLEQLQDGELLRQYDTLIQENEILRQRCSILEININERTPKNSEEINSLRNIIQHQQQQIQQFQSLYNSSNINTPTQQSNKKQSPKGFQIRQGSRDNNKFFQK
ncbi:hypothetical protein pb186bvf_020488 [Paramecium bursaria]